MQPRTPPRRALANARRGFSLAELVAIMVIIGITAGVMVSVTMRLDGARAGAAAGRIESDVAFARHWALATGTRTWVEFDLPAQSWRVLTEDPAAPGRAGATPLDDPGTGKALGGQVGRGAFVGVTLDSALFGADPVVGFDWLGRPLDASASPLGADGSVVLGSGTTISVQVSTGHVSRSTP